MTENEKQKKLAKLRSAPQNPFHAMTQNNPNVTAINGTAFSGHAGKHLMDNSQQVEPAFNGPRPSMGQALGRVAGFVSGGAVETAKIAGGGAMNVVSDIGTGFSEGFRATDRKPVEDESGPEFEHTAEELAPKGITDYFPYTDVPPPSSKEPAIVQDGFNSFRQGKGTKTVTLDDAVGLFKNKPGEFGRTGVSSGFGVSKEEQDQRNALAASINESAQRMRMDNLERLAAAGSRRAKQELAELRDFSLKQSAVNAQSSKNSGSSASAQFQERKFLQQRQDNARKEFRERQSKELTASAKFLEMPEASVENFMNANAPAVQSILSELGVDAPADQTIMLSVLANLKRLTGKRDSSFFSRNFGKTDSELMRKAVKEAAQGSIK